MKQHPSARKIALRTISALALISTIGLTWLWLSVTQEEVEFTNGPLTLRGTLLAPRFGTDLSAVVLVHGSGAASRKSLMPYAWIFASKGYAALVYDKRGVGQSGGDALESEQFNFENLAGDAASGYRLLQSHDRIKPDRVGYLGVSQGGWVAALAAHQVDEPAFMVMISASLSTVAEDRIYGREALIRHLGLNTAEVAEARELMARDHQVTRTGLGFPELQASWRQYASTDWFRAARLPENPQRLDDPHRVWERTVLDFDPRPMLDQIDSPILWIFGDQRLDRFSPVALSLSRVAAAQAVGKPWAIMQFEGAGHTLELDGGNPIETIVEVRLPLILDLFEWLEGID